VHRSVHYTAGEHADRLEGTIEELMALARDQHPEDAVADLQAIFDDLDRQWHDRFAQLGRHFDLRVDVDAGHAAISPAALRHSLDVLISNAHDHGSGRVTAIAAPATGGGITTDVTDEGPGFADPDTALTRRRPEATGHRIGLPLAVSLIDAEGGRLSSPAPDRHQRSRIIVPRTGDLA
jgi:signal transduction histidine kinase